MRQGVPGEAGRELLGGPPRRPPPAPAAQRRAMAAEQLMVLYEDDSVEVHYADGARLLLSPCGSEYLYEEALPATAHPLQPAESTRQRVPFVLSAYREQILRALDFRNTFSSRPYLPSRIISPERKRIIFSDILEVRWPDPVTADLTRCIRNGSVKISSVDGYAHLYLSELQQEFTVEFLCKVSQPFAASSPFSPKNSNYKTKDQYGKSNKNYVPEMSSKQMRLDNRNNEDGHAGDKHREATKSNNQRDRDGVPLFYTNCCSEYTWVTQRWSVSSCPEEWKYPLSLALMCNSLHTAKNVLKTCEENNHASTGADVLQDPKAYEAVSRLPAALPISCRAPHLHRWSFCDFFLQNNQDSGKYSYPQLIQIVWCKGVLYRLIHGKRNITEVYPGDESLFKSEGDFLGNYFVHYAIQKGMKKREEKMYWVNSLPPDIPGSQYSVSSIITEATKMLQYCYKTKLSLIHNYHLCCWKMVPETDGREMLPVLLDEKVIPGTGRLLVYSDHKVHAVFWDGISLSMVWDFSSCYTKIQVNEDVGWCKLTTPDGAQQLIQIRHPGIYERYIRTVIGWCRSLNESKEALEFTTHTVTEENWSADAELEKIQRFNFLLDNSNVLEGTSAAKSNLSVKKTESGIDPEEISKGHVLEALQNTSRLRLVSVGTGNTTPSVPAPLTPPPRGEHDQEAESGRSRTALPACSAATHASSLRASSRGGGERGPGEPRAAAAPQPWEPGVRGGADRALCREPSRVAGCSQLLLRDTARPQLVSPRAWKKLVLVFPALDPAGYSNSSLLTAQTTFSTGNKQLQKCVLLGPGTEDT